jgi:long-chain acyl-CoA synthetase
MIQMGWVYGVQAGFYQGDVQKLAEDLQVLKPTIFPCVPRLLNRFYDLMQKKLSDVTGVKKFVVDWAIKTKTKALEFDGTATHGIWDKKVFDKFKGM